MLGEIWFMKLCTMLREVWYNDMEVCTMFLVGTEFC